MTETFDLIVCGAGAGGMTAAFVSYSEYMRFLLLEKTGLIGGTTAWSGGMVWAPANWLTAMVGRPDTLDAARRYLQETMQDGFNAAQREAFLTRANEAVTWLGAHTPVQFVPVMRYPDYYPDRVGAMEGGRVLEPCPFDASLLGSRFDLLRPPLPEFMLFGGMMVSRPDLAHFRRIGRSSHATWRVLSLLTRYAWQRKHAARGTTLYLGNALAGRLLLALGQHHVTLRTNAPVARLLQEGSRVCGVLLADGTLIPAGRGVVLATGGFSHDPALRARFLPRGAGMLSAVTPASTGDGARLGQQAGGHIGPEGVNGAFWVPVSRFRRADGSDCMFPHTVGDRAKPGLIAVDRTGRRFVNEAASYHEFVLAMLRNPNAGGGPVWLLADARFVWRASER